MVKRKQKVLMALSGGIDSAVSAHLLLKQGYEVEAAFMKNWSSTVGLIKNECPWLSDRQDALRVAAFLRIPLHTLDFEKQYQDRVMSYFFDEYQKGRTPNPDVMCNKEIKFKLLYDWAMAHKYDYLATGHYAKIGYRAQGTGRRGNSALNPERFTLMRSKDEFKDQTYFIYNIRQEQLPHLLFPVGGLKKTEVKKIANKIGLPNAGKKESMGLCFVGKIRLQEFLNQKLKPCPGPIVDKNGIIIGEHQGLYNFTIGQRQGVKVGATGPYYVIKKDMQTNTLHVTDDPDDKALLTREVQIHSMNFINSYFRLHIVCQRQAFTADLNPTSKIKNLKLTGRYRHQGELASLNVAVMDNGHYRVVFSKPQKAIASGQSLVLYDGKTCLGGGIIA